MNILDLWFTQSRLNRISELDTLIDLVRSGSKFKTRIELQETEDGEIQIHNGHHRILAMFCSGKWVLEQEDYILEIGNFKPRFGKVASFSEYYLSRGLICNFQSMAT